jgi:two-component system, chemotaxis family, protein-glutamate methylesterase/glutaminase
MRERACAQRANILARHQRVFNASRFTSAPPPLASADAASALITIGGSAGALEAVIRIPAALPATSRIAVAIALHAGVDSHLVPLIQRQAALSVRWAATGDRLQAGHVYVVPPCCHLVINPDGQLTVSSAPPRRTFRPSIDWLFESAAVTFRERHVAVVLSGRLNDGARGIRRARCLGGSTLAPDPGSCRFPDMPLAAIETGCVDEVVSACDLPKAVAAAANRFGEHADLRWIEPFAS